MIIFGIWMLGIMILTKEEKMYWNIVKAKKLMKPKAESPWKKVMELLMEKLPIHKE